MGDLVAQKPRLLGVFCHVVLAAGITRDSSNSFYNEFIVMNSSSTVTSGSDDRSQPHLRAVSEFPLAMLVRRPMPRGVEYAACSFIRSAMKRNLRRTNFLLTTGGFHRWLGSSIDEGEAALPVTCPSAHSSL